MLASLLTAPTFSKFADTHHSRASLWRRCKHLQQRTSVNTCCPAALVCYRGCHTERSDYKMYAESKVKLFMLTAELQRRLHAAGSTTDVFSVHPGVAQTDIFPKSDQGKLGAKVLAAGAVAVGQSPGGGARSILKVATDPSLAGTEIALLSCCCWGSHLPGTLVWQMCTLVAAC